MTGLKVNGTHQPNQAASNTLVNSESSGKSHEQQKNSVAPIDQARSTAEKKQPNGIVSNSSEKPTKTGTTDSAMYSSQSQKTNANNVSSPEQPNDRDVATGTEIGLMFVQQYYTLMNLSPKYLHCFYKKSSTMVRGLENEDVKPQVGQRDIHNQFMEYNFKNCKVVVSSVDCQASVSGSYVIVVIGVLSNNDEPPKRFIQTFVLCKQATGFFVLNDIFRFLKDPLETRELDDLVEVKIEDGEFKLVDTRDSQPSIMSQETSAPKSPEIIDAPTSVTETPQSEKTATYETSPSAADATEKDKDQSINPTSKPKKDYAKSNTKKVDNETSQNNPTSKPKSSVTTTNSQEEASLETNKPSSYETTTKPNSKDASVDKKSNPDETKPTSKNLERTNSNSRRENPDNSSSVCLKFVKEGTTEADIMSVFQVFGKVRSVEFRNQVVFVNFDSPEARTKALSHGKISVCDQSVRVEPRRQQFNSNRNSYHNRGPSGSFRNGRSRTSNQKPTAPTS